MKFTNEIPREYIEKLEKCVDIEIEDNDDIAYAIRTILDNL